MRGGDLLARIVAAIIVGLFVVAQVIAFFDKKRVVPPELWPLVTLSAMYLFRATIVERNGRG